MNHNPIENIRLRLTQTLHPTHVEIIDESHLHVGHRPANAAGGHYQLRIASPCFEGKSLKECHQMVYAALQPLMPQHIHALGIKILRH